MKQVCLVLSERAANTLRAVLDYESQQHEGEDGELLGKIHDEILSQLAGVKSVAVNDDGELVAEWGGQTDGPKRQRKSAARTAGEAMAKAAREAVENA